MVSDGAALAAIHCMAASRLRQFCCKKATQAWQVAINPLLCPRTLFQANMQTPSPCNTASHHCSSMA